MRVSCLQENDFEILNTSVFFGNENFNYMNASWNKIHEIVGEFSADAPQLELLYLQHNR